MIEEKWVPIMDATSYEASTTGRIRSVDRYITSAPGSKPYLKKGRILTPVDNGKGYLGVTLNKQRLYVHRIIANTFLTPIAGKNEVNHKDGNKSNNAPSNLEWTDRLENVRHAAANGLLTGYDMSGKGNPRYKHGERVRIDSLKKCALCQNEFTAKYQSSLYCSKLCSGRVHAKNMTKKKAIVRSLQFSHVNQ